LTDQSSPSGAPESPAEALSNEFRFVGDRLNTTHVLSGDSAG
jgi:hypothetical protein